MKLTTVEQQVAMIVANNRTSMHSRHASQNILKEGADFVGLVGEMCFANAFDIEMDFTKRIGGDKGVDFVINNRTIDVKTARAWNGSAVLLVKEGTVVADYYVLATYERREDGVYSYLIGYATKEEVLAAEPQKWPREVTNHVIKEPHKMNASAFLADIMFE